MTKEKVKNTIAYFIRYSSVNSLSDTVKRPTDKIIFETISDIEVYSVPREIFWMLEVSINTVRFSIQESLRK